ncbi:hypothetical protein HX122_11415 [Acinetobacter towneri]|nr:hypothetical protein [Acinetobacter towneri]MDM1755550.1 hypothetical protein [Acinetobacter towneri]
MNETQLEVKKSQLLIGLVKHLRDQNVCIGSYQKNKQKLAGKKIGQFVS